MKNWSLTSKLIASVLALFLAVTIAIGGATVLTMNRVLEAQLTDQLTTQTQSLDDSGQGDGDGHPRRFFECQAPNQNGPNTSAEGLLRLCTQGSTVTTDYVAHPGSYDTLSTSTISTLRAAGMSETPRTIDLGDDLGTYLVKAQSVQAYDTSGNIATYTVYTGLPTSKVHQSVMKLLLTVVLAGLGGFLLMGVLGTMLVRSSLVPLRRVAGTAQRVAELELARGDVSLAERVPAEYTNTRTEVGQVGNALNQMLDHVDEALTARQESEQRVRQFVADASHELRTPLASIRGYAELSRKEREPVPDGVRHALDRIESEAKRMTGLVEDMLLLARLDAGRPLEHRPVDLTMMLIETLGDIQAAAPEHVWKLHLPDEAVEVVGDAGRLKQVVVNLLGNARAHTPAGTTVTGGLEVEPDSVRLIVHDDGPGIPESLVPNLFQRFTRADEARNRAAGSTGLGLSIVDAVVKAHHGRVDVASRPGATTFTVTLPRG